MKKTLMVTALLLAVSGSAYAGDIATGGVSAAGAAIYGGSDSTVAQAATNPIVKLSTGVKGGAAYNSVAYALFTKHEKGSKIFGTANDSTSVYWKADPAGALVTGDVGSTSGTTAFASGWTTY